MGHIHIGLTMGLAAFGMVVLVGTFWRLLAMKLGDSPIGQAMAFMY